MARPKPSTVWKVSSVKRTTFGDIVAALPKATPDFWKSRVLSKVVVHRVAS